MRMLNSMLSAQSRSTGVCVAPATMRRSAADEMCAADMIVATAARMVFAKGFIGFRLTVFANID